MWEARAEYADGYTVSRLYSCDDTTPENEQQYNIECWLLSRHEGCIWYSVNYIEEA